MDRIQARFHSGGYIITIHSDDDSHPFQYVNSNESNPISGYAVCPETGLLGGSSVRSNRIPLRYIMDLFKFLDLTVRYRIMNMDCYSYFEYHYDSRKDEDSNAFEKGRYT